MLKRAFICRDPCLLKDLYVSWVRPNIEYAVQAWIPFLKGDIKKIEKFQERESRIPYGFDELEYEERLRRLNLITLKDGRIRRDIIEMYKIVKGN